MMFVVAKVVAFTGQLPERTWLPGNYKVKLFIVAKDDMQLPGSYKLTLFVVRDDTVAGQL